MNMGATVSRSVAMQGLLLLILYSIIMVFIGIGCNKRYANNLSGFITGGRTIGPWLFAFSYGATYLSSSAFIGSTGTAAIGGLSYLLVPVPQMIFLPVGLLVLTHGLRKMSVRLDAITVSEFIARRYKSPASGLVASILTLIFMIPYMVGVIKAGAVSMQQLLGVSYHIGVFLIGGVACLYLLLGGFKARCYTDVVQGALMSFGMLMVLVAGFIVIGSPAQITAQLAAIDQELVQVPGPLGWSEILLFSIVFAISPWGLPHLTQISFTVKSKKTIYLSAVVLTLWISLMLFGSAILGNMGRAYFGNQVFQDPDSVFPALVITLFPNILGGIVICAIIAAAMSTVDSVLMTSSSAFSCDIYKRFLKKDATDKETLRVTHLTMIVISLIVILWAFNPPKLLLNVMSYAFSVIAGGLLVPIFMGIHNRKGTGKACLASMLVGTATTLLWYIVKVNGDYMLQCPPFIIGIAFSLVVFLVVSRHTKPLPEEFVADLFSKEAEEAAYDS